MRVAFLTVVLSLATFLSPAAQQTGPASPQPLQILQQALSALNGSTVTHDVTLIGSANYVAGSDNETGTATLEAIATGASSVSLTLPSGPRGEIRDLTANPPRDKAFSRFFNLSRSSWNTKMVVRSKVIAIALTEVGTVQRSNMASISSGDIIRGSSVD